MGIFFNPGNGSFTKDRNYEIYVDKTELLKYLNRAIGTPKNCIAVSHARRFGKSHAAGMIVSTELKYGYQQTVLNYQADSPVIGTNPS